LIRILTCIAITCSVGDVHSADKSNSGTCTIVNAKDDDVVIGIYRPTAKGVEERLVEVPARSQIDGVPILLTEGDHFAIAYRAEGNGDTIKRASPIKIAGHRRINFIRKKSDAKSPDVLIEFRGFPTFVDDRDTHQALYIPYSEGEAKRVIDAANKTTKVVEAPLARSTFQKK